MRKFFILMLFALNLVYFNQAMALSSSHIDQSIIFNEDGKSGDKKDGDKKDGEKNPEENCE